jgi:hypothetical protein
MLLSGENYIYTPKTQEISFVFENLYVDNVGVAEVGFSGEESKFYFLISGERLIDPSNNFAYTCSPDSLVTISGDFNGAKYRYFINGELSSDGKSKDGFNVEKFYAKTTGCQLGMSLQMMCKPISYEILFDKDFPAGGFVNGEISNYSNIDFKILGSRIIHPEYIENFTGLVAGIVPAQGTLDFKLWDVSNLLSVPEADATLELDTTIGGISHNLSPRRVSGFFGDTVSLSVVADPNTSIEPYFYGCGDW